MSLSSTASIYFLGINIYASIKSIHHVRTGSIDFILFVNIPRLFSVYSGINRENKFYSNNGRHPFFFDFFISFSSPPGTKRHPPTHASTTPPSTRHRRKQRRRRQRWRAPAGAGKSPNWPPPCPPPRPNPRPFRFRLVGGHRGVSARRLKRGAPQGALFSRRARRQ